MARLRSYLLLVLCVLRVIRLPEFCQQIFSAFPDDFPQDFLLQKRQRLSGKSRRETLDVRQRTICVFLPLMVSAVLPDENTETILIADDEQAIRTIVQEMLRECGYRVIVAVDGADALEKAKAHKGTIHLLLSDIQMPRKTGIEVAAQFADDRPETKVLLMSGCVSVMPIPNDEWQFLPKPFTREILTAKIRDALAHAPDQPCRLRAVAPGTAQRTSGRFRPGKHMKSCRNGNTGSPTA